MNLPENVQPVAPIRRKTSPVPRVGELVQVRSRRWLVDEVIEPKSPGQTCVVRLSCADDDAQGQSLEVLWNYELDRLILEEEGWADLPASTTAMVGGGRAALTGAVTRWYVTPLSRWSGG
jgi:hypothetical protein